MGHSVQQCREKAKAVPRRHGERPCGRIINFDKVEDEFDEELLRWFQMAAAMGPTERDGTDEGLYGRHKCEHQQAAEAMAHRLNRLRRERSGRASSG